MNDELKLDEVGEWTELKIDIIKKYAKAYSTILSRQNLHHFYIDAFAGAGEHVSKTTGAIIPGSPLVALKVTPPFKEYHLIDLNKARTANLRELTKSNPNVYIYNDDCNKVMLDIIVPKIRYDQYRRALCILDPYGLQLSWEVIQEIGKMKTFDIFLHFPIAAMNRNVLRHNRSTVLPDLLNQMDNCWGDRSWQDAAYKMQPGLFCETEIKSTNKELISAFRKRLKSVAGFKFVPEPLPMKNSTGGIVYYLFFASEKAVAKGIVEDIFKKAREGKYRGVKK